MKRNKERMVYIHNDYLVDELIKTNNKDKRRKIVKDFLNKNFSGKPIAKNYSSGVILIKNTKTDTKHLLRNEHLDTSIALTQVVELIEKSDYISETAVDIKEKPASPNNYYWFFKVTICYEGKKFEYKLNIGRNKTDSHCSLYDITNNKKGADSYRISNPGNNTPSKENITNSVDKVK